MRQVQRHIALDALRGLAVLLAMLDHVKVQFVPDMHLLVPLTRLATPCFVILFGAMIEIAYLSRLRDGRLQEGGLQSGALAPVRRRLALRMRGSALWFAGLGLAAALSGNLTPAEALRSLVGLGPGRFNEILLVYTLLFAVTIALLPWLWRYGALPVLALAALGWALKALAEGKGLQPGYLATLLTGIGTGYGPALLPTMSFLGFGLALGETLTRRRSALLPAGLALLALLCCGFELSHGIAEAGRRFLAHRWTNHPGYYAVGTLGFLCIGAGLQWALHRPLLSRGVRGLARIGRQSLFVYGGGNLALNLLPMIALPRPLGLCVAAGFLVALLGLARVAEARRARPGAPSPA